MRNEGLTGEASIPELACRYHAILRGEIPCPAMPDCADYQRALAEGRGLRCNQPRQLSFLWLA